MSPTLVVVQHVDHEDAALVGELARKRGMTLEILRPDRCWASAWGRSSWLWLQGAACNRCRWAHHRSK